MSERRILLRTDDGCEIEVTWAEGERKFSLEISERAPVAQPEPAPSPETGAPIEHLRAPSEAKA